MEFEPTMTVMGWLKVRVKNSVFTTACVFAMLLGIGPASSGQSGSSQFETKGQGGMTDGGQLVSPDGERLTALTGAELRAILPGASWSYVPRTQFVEIFRCDGTWTLVGPRIPASGPFSIRDNQFCTETASGRTSCARLLRSETGRLFVQPVPGTVSVLRSFGEISITPPARACPQKGGDK